MRAPSSCRSPLTLAITTPRPQRLAAAPKDQLRHHDLGGDAAEVFLRDCCCSCQSLPVPQRGLPGIN